MKPLLNWPHKEVLIKPLGPDVIVQVPENHPQGLVQAAHERRFTLANNRQMSVHEFSGFAEAKPVYRGLMRKHDKRFPWGLRYSVVHESLLNLIQTEWSRYLDTRQVALILGYERTTVKCQSCENMPPNPTMPEPATGILLWHKEPKYEPDREIKFVCEYCHCTYTGDGCEYLHLGLIYSDYCFTGSPKKT